MNLFQGAVRAVTKAADATTAAAGAVGGAAVNSVVGALEGAASGMRNGASSGSHSTAAAALTLGAVGAVGLVDWPVLLAVGGTALLVHQLAHRGNGQPTASSSDESSAAASPRVKPSTNRAPAKAKKAAPRKPSTARKS